MSKKYEQWSPKGFQLGPNMEPKTFPRDARKIKKWGSILRGLLGSSWAPFWLHFWAFLGDFGLRFRWFSHDFRTMLGPRSHKFRGPCWLTFFWKWCHLRVILVACLGLSGHIWVVSSGIISCINHLWICMASVLFGSLFARLFFSFFLLLAALSGPSCHYRFRKVPARVLEVLRVPFRDS